MNILFLHNLQTAICPEQAEFDTPETVQAICDLLESQGHRVTKLDASEGAKHLFQVLESSNADLVLNTAEGTTGRGREGFYPALLEQFGLPYTGSDAYVCTLTLDKYLTNLSLREVGVRTPWSRLVTRSSEARKLFPPFPVILKPNFEGSSKGISSDSIVENQARFEQVLRDLLKSYPNGVIVEEFIPGSDVTVPFIEGLGVLEPAQYDFGSEACQFTIYDYELKQEQSDKVQVICPAPLEEKQKRELIEMSRIAIETLGIRDLCRIDFRIDGGGRAHFIEVNALPSLEPGAAIYVSARNSGLRTDAEVLEAIIKSALKRHKREQPKRSTKKEQVALVYNLKREKVTPQSDGDAEFDSPDTVEALRSAIEACGFNVKAVEATPELPQKLSGIDLVFNIAEGLRGRYRESQVPALVELLGLEFTGSESGSLAICHDKGLAKRIVAAAGVATPKFLSVESLRGFDCTGIRFPAIVKPVAEGSSKGLLADCVCLDRSQLVSAINKSLVRYRQAVLVEEFLPGREFTVGVLGGANPKILPIMEIVFRGDSENPIYSFEDKHGNDAQVDFQVPAQIPASLRAAIRKAAKLSFQALGCRDVARLDFRLDAHGVVNFIECNPLPGLSPGFSDLCVIAEAAGMDYQKLVQEILKPALRRHRRRKRALV